MSMLQFQRQAAQEPAPQVELAVVVLVVAKGPDALADVAVSDVDSHQLFRRLDPFLCGSPHPGASVPLTSEPLWYVPPLSSVRALVQVVPVAPSVSLEVFQAWCLVVAVRCPLAPMVGVGADCSR